MAKISKLPQISKGEMTRLRRLEEERQLASQPRGLGRLMAPGAKGAKSLEEIQRLDDAARMAELISIRMDYNGPPPIMVHRLVSPTEMDTLCEDPKSANSPEEGEPYL